MKRKAMLSKLLFEQESGTIPMVNPGESTQPQNYSLDERVDKFLVQYERESNPQAAQFSQDSGMDKALVSKGGTQGAGAGFAGGQSAAAVPISMPKAIQETYKKRTFSMILEQEDPMAGTGGDMGGDIGSDPLGGAAGGDAGMGGMDSGNQPEATQKPPVPKPQINLSLFTSKVARLISNFETLVDPKTIMVNRIYAFLRQNYDEKTAKEFLITLESTYEISNKTPMQKRTDLVGEVPSAVGAGSGGSGGDG